MANRRMFSKTITNKGSFLMMPGTTQLLYFHLGQNADDDGFVEAYTVMNMIRATEGDIEWLAEKKLIELFEGFVCFITHWRINNEIRVDRYTPSVYQNLKPGHDFRATIKIDGSTNGSTIGSPQGRVGKDRSVQSSPISKNITKGEIPALEASEKSPEEWAEYVKDLPI